MVCEGSSHQITATQPNSEQLRPVRFYAVKGSTLYPAGCLCTIRDGLNRQDGKAQSHPRLYVFQASTSQQGCKSPKLDGIGVPGTCEHNGVPIEGEMREYLSHGLIFLCSTRSLRWNLLLHQSNQHSPGRLRGPLVNAMKRDGDLITSTLSRQANAKNIHFNHRVKFVVQFQMLPSANLFARLSHLTNPIMPKPYQPQVVGTHVVMRNDPESHVCTHVSHLPITLYPDPASTIF
eukprot:6480988-Amphidinium_carterae.1